MSLERNGKLEAFKKKCLQSGAMLITHFGQMISAAGLAPETIQADKLDFVLACRSMAGELNEIANMVESGALEELPVPRVNPLTNGVAISEH